MLLNLPRFSLFFLFGNGMETNPEQPFPDELQSSPNFVLLLKWLQHSRDALLRPAGQAESAFRCSFLASVPGILTYFLLEETIMPSEKQILPLVFLEPTGFPSYSSNFPSLSYFVSKLMVSCADFLMNHHLGFPNFRPADRGLCLQDSFVVPFLTVLVGWG